MLVICQIILFRTTLGIMESWYIHVYTMCWHS